MSKFIVPKGYKSPLSLYDTQVGIKTVKDFFQTSLAYELDLHRVSAPVFVTPESGLNDNLNGVERPVSFDIKYAILYSGVNPYVFSNSAGVI